MRNPSTPTEKDRGKTIIIVIIVAHGGMDLANALLLYQFRQAGPGTDRGQ